HPDGHVDRLELRLQCERVDDHRQHAHVVTRRLLDPVLRDRGATNDVAAAYDYGHLDAELAHLADLLGEITGVLGRDAELSVSEEGFTGELQHHPAVLGLRLNGHLRQSRWVRRWFRRWIGPVGTSGTAGRARSRRSS